MEGGSEKSREFPSTYYRLDSATGNRSFKLGNSEQEHVITTPTGGLQHDDRRLAFNRQNSVRQSPNFLTPISIIPNEFAKPQLSRSLSSNANNSFSRRPLQPNSFYSPRVPDTSKHQHHHHHHHAFESSRNGSCLIEDGSLGHQKSAMRMILRAIVEVCTCGTRPMKSLFALILMNVAYSSLELLIGLFTGRVGLVSDAFHLSFGCWLLSFSLIAMVVARKKPDDVYTYGYKRVEVLAAFTNTLFLLFLSFSLAVEALHAFVQDEEEHKHYLIVSAASNLLVNLIGVWFFRGYARINIVYRKAEDMNYHSICLHVLSDSIRSAGLILASWLLTLGVKNAEMLCLGLVSVAIFVVVLPLFKASGGILLQTAPTGMASSAFNKCLRQVNALEDVVEVSQVRFWDLVPGYIVGQISLQIKKGSEENRLLKHIHSLFSDIGVKDLTIQTEFV